VFCECRDILVRRGRRVVLEAGELVIPAGRITSVVGPNGAGKTTLLEVIALLRRVARGSVRLWGRPARPGDRQLQHRMVMVMHPGCMFRGTVWDNMMYGLKARGIARLEARGRAREALARVGLPHLAGRDAQALSSGERQRLNLARAIALRPAAMLLDEPTANVDGQTVAVIRELLAALRDGQGTTIVHTTPSGNGLGEISDGVVELDGGKVKGACERC